MKLQCQGALLESNSQDIIDVMILSCFYYARFPPERLQIIVPFWYLSVTCNSLGVEAAVEGFFFALFGLLGVSPLVGGDVRQLCTLKMQVWKV